MDGPTDETVINMDVQTQCYLLGVCVANEKIGSLDVGVDVLIVMNVLKHIKLHKHICTESQKKPTPFLFLA